MTNKDDLKEIADILGWHGHIDCSDQCVSHLKMKRIAEATRQQLVKEVLEGVNGINHADCDCGRDSADCPAYKAHDKIVAVIKFKLTKE